MAVVATLSKGYDLDYIWKQVDRGPAKDAASYYIQASESGGEPPGRWWGPGAKALGLEPGQRVERKPYDLLFGKRKAPDGTPLGKPPDGGRKAADLYARLLAAEPHATAGRKHELRIEATGQTRQSPLFFDLTISLSKSHLNLPRLARRERPPGPPSRRPGRRPVLVRPGHRGRRHDLAGRAHRIRVLPAGGRLHPHRLAQHPGTRPGDRPVARGRPGRGALAAAHLPGRRHAAARPLPDRPHRQDQHRREMARPRLPGLQRARRRHRRDRLPAPGRSPHPQVRPGMDCPRRRPRLRNQGHQRADDAPVLLPPRIDHRRPARARRAIRAALRTQALPARTRTSRASRELQDAQRQARHAGHRAGARRLGRQARADARREPGLGRAIGVARRDRPRRHARARRERTRSQPSSTCPAPRRKRSRSRSKKRAPGPAPM